MRHPQHWYFPQFRCNMRKISAKRYRRAKLLLCKQTTDNFRTRNPPEPRWRHLSGNRILFVPHCSETVVINLHIIGNTFVNIRIHIVTHCILIISIGFRLFAIAEFISIVNNRKKYSAMWKRGFIWPLVLKCIEFPNLKFSSMDKFLRCSNGADNFNGITYQLDVIP